MRRPARLLWLAAMLATMLANRAAIADTVEDEARAAAAAARAAIGVLSEEPAIEGTPGYTDNPEQTSLGGSQADRDEAAAEQTAACANEAQPTPECEALNTVRNDEAVRQAAPPMDNDPEVAAARNLGTTALDNPDLGYSACGTEDRQVGTVTTDIQSCHDYYLRVLDQMCTKVLQVTVTWHCAAGAEGTFNYPNGDYYCNREIIHYNPSCGAGETLVGSGQFAQCRDADGNLRAADMETETEIVEEAALPTVTDHWINPCADMESRVPPGLLLPDGDNSEPVGGAPTGRLDKCERVNSVCSDEAPQERFINRLWVNRQCWAYTNTFNCVNQDPRSDCDQPRFGQCTPAGERCDDFDAFDPTICTLWTKDFSCVTSDTRRTESVTSCAGQTYTDQNGMVWDTGHPPNGDFAQVVSFMEIARQAGKYNEDGNELFTGFDNRCRKRLFGLVNCCARSGGPAAAFNNLAVALEAGLRGPSPWTFDALFGTDSPKHVKRGFSVATGGDEQTVTDLLNGDFSVENVLSTLSPSFWANAVLALSNASLMNCTDREKELAMKRDAGLCDARGSYCSRRLRFIRTCIERTETYCCFNSILAKLINRQGKAQLGQGLGTARNPNCGGFTAIELQQLDLATMDFTEFYDSIHPAPVDPTDTAARADPDTCYYGAGQCPPPP